MNAGVRVARRDIALAAANKDGGAHVDAELPPEYQRLIEGLWVMMGTGKHVAGQHLLYLRQMGFEILNSPDLSALAGAEPASPTAPAVDPNTGVDGVVEAIFRRLCDHQRAQGVGAAMSLAELRLALGVTEAELIEAVKVARISDDLFLTFTANERVTLGPSWRERCEGEGSKA